MISKLFRTCTVASVAIATVSLLTAPAQAMSFFSFGGDARLENADDEVSNLNFYGLSETINGDSGPINTGTVRTGASSQVAPQTTFSIRDLALTKRNEDRWVVTARQLPIEQFLFSQGGATFSYDLTRFVLRRNNQGAFLGTIEGFLRQGNTLLGQYNGGFSTESELLSVRGTTFSANLNLVEEQDVNAAVPTPAMLPGLVGVTLGMVRKRKKQATA